MDPRSAPGFREEHEVLNIAVKEVPIEDVMTVVAGFLNEQGGTRLTLTADGTKLIMGTD
jgi:hypothetical protein